ncbi:MAG: hypothetical protein ACK55Z_15025, partial [bacterium]
RGTPGRGRRSTARQRPTGGAACGRRAARRRRPARPLPSSGGVSLDRDGPGRERIVLPAGDPGRALRRARRRPARTGRGRDLGDRPSAPLPGRDGGGRLARARDEYGTAALAGGSACRR